MTHTAHPKARTVILISGRGSNMMSLVEASQKNECHIDVVAVISSRPNAGGLTFAQDKGIKTDCLDHTQFDGREAFDTALMDVIDQHKPDLVILAGFMRILTPEFTRHYAGRMLNIHPSLLPKYTGLNTHARALASGDAEHGASVHFVTEELDGGPVVLQSVVPILDNDTEDTLTQRVLKTEHSIYPLVADWFGKGVVKCEHDSVIYNERILQKAIKWTDGKIIGESDEHVQTHHSEHSTHI